MGDKDLNGSLTAAGGLASQISSQVVDGNLLNTNLNSLNSFHKYDGYTTTISSSWNDTYTLKVSDEITEKEYFKRKSHEILDDIKDFCDNYCVLKCEDICDGESKAQCPLWNRLKCEKRV